LPAILIALCILSPTIFCLPKDSERFKIYNSSYGFSLESESNGSAFGAFYSFNVKRKIQLFFHAKVLDIVGDAEFPVFDWYTGTYYKTNTKNLLLLPIFGGVKYHHFEGQIANNFSPYVTCTLGPNLIIDLPERVGFIKQWKNVQTFLSSGVFVGIGVDFMIQTSTYFSVAMGYDLLPMGREVDGERDYSGTVVKFMIGRIRRP